METSLKAISPIGIDVTVPWSVSVCLSVMFVHQCISKVTSTRFLLYTTAPCISQIALKFG